MSLWSEFAPIRGNGRYKTIADSADIDKEIIKGTCTGCRK